MTQLYDFSGLGLINPELVEDEGAVLVNVFTPVLLSLLSTHWPHM